MITRKFLLRSCALALVLVMLTGLAACGSRGKGASADLQNPSSKLTTVNWKDSDDATFKEDEKEVAPNTALAGKTADGKDIFTFMRFEVGVEFFENEVRDARLFLKVIGNDKPSQLRLGLVTAFWDGFFNTYEEAKSFVDEGGAVTVDVKDEGEGWVSLPLTDYVKKWLCGEAQNNGIAISGLKAGQTFTFGSIVGADAKDDDIAYIKVSGEAKDRPLTYGKFGYTEIVSSDEMHSNGNCLSYALRDTNDILGSDMGVDIGEMKSIYTKAGAEGGLDALADYFAGHVEKYVEAHKDSLKISGFRRLNSFDSIIDPAAEYRIALRAGVNLFGEEVDFSDSHSWDFHFWAQLNDGRWAQKFPPVSSVIVPCTGPEISPGRFPWDSGIDRTDKTADYYKSKVIYFAVTKNVDAFTQHRGETENRPVEQ